MVATGAVIAGNAEIDGGQGFVPALVLETEDDRDATGLVDCDGNGIIEFESILGLAEFQARSVGIGSEFENSQD